MKITSINGKESDEHNLAFNIGNRLPPVVFEHFKLLAAVDPMLRNFTPSMSETSPSLIMHSANPFVSVATDDFVQAVERILDAAEKLVEGEVTARRQKENAQYKQNRAAIEMVAKKLGL